jgi:starch phosphorylase
MRESMSCLTPQFSANRTVREYSEKYYIPAATILRQRVADKGSIGKQMISWQKVLEEKWGSLHFGEVKVETKNKEHVFNAQVFLNDLDPSAVKVELFANGIKDNGLFRQEMKRMGDLVGHTGGYIYSTKVSADRPVSDYTPRLMPQGNNIAVPLEEELILWQR